MTMARMAWGETPYSLPKAESVSPCSRRSLIFETSATGILRFLFRCLLATSSMLSACVPSTRWLGFTQEGVSQVWRITGLEGSPSLKKKDSRCGLYRFPLKLNSGYLLPENEPVQCQHWSRSWRSTLDQNAHHKEQNLLTPDASCILNFWEQWSQLYITLAFVIGLPGVCMGFKNSTKEPLCAGV